MAKKETLEELLDEALVPIDEQPYQVPENWVWMYTPCLFDIEYGKNLPTSQLKETGYPVFGANGQIGYYDEYTYEEPKILVSCRGANSGAVNVSLSKSFITNNSLILKEKCDMPIEFVRYLFECVDKSALISGTAQPQITLKSFDKFPLPLPPYEEQQRISNKIKFLFFKIDKAKELIEEAREGFENRKTTILAKAFKGELTKKWREENVSSMDAVELFNKIKEERFKVIETKRENDDLIKMYENFDYCNHNKPNSWIQLKSNMFCYNINCGSTPTAHIASEGEVPFLKVYNIVDNKLDFEYKPQFIPKNISDDKLKKSKLIPNDVIMNIVGPPLRKIAIIPDYYPQWNMNQAIVRFRPIKYILPKYLYYALLNEETLDGVIAETRGVVGQSNISVSQSRNLLIPIPPLKEQKEIVHILDKLLEDESKIDQLTQLEEQIELLKKSILAKAFRGQLGTNDLTEESALELLKKVLKDYK